jgi:4-hydroxythreonine-4-phosphate dehydrogenase
LSDLPLIGITMGDPAGIGPEIIVRALEEGDISRYCRPLVLGDPAILSSVLPGISQKKPLNIVTRLEHAGRHPDRIDLMALSELKGEGILPGKPTLAGGKAMVGYITKAVEMALKGELAAVVTGPINKALMNRAGYPYEGHTQLISLLTKTRDTVMMLAGERLRVALVTIHCALREVPAILDRARVYRTIVITAQALQRDFGLESPRIAVAALNPHAGESNLFGSEEEEIILPAVREASEDGYPATGPLPADTLFYQAASGRFDAVVAMYHDQGLIPLKLLHFPDAVNVTLGLPIIRTSVDHGTAYDIAGTGRADPSSLKAAIKLAAIMVKNKMKKRAHGE